MARQKSSATKSSATTSSVTSLAASTNLKPPPNHVPKPKPLSLTNPSSTKDNTHLPLLPPNYTIQTRPIIHPPIPSPYAGTAVPKVVYVSSRTPFMAAVKRVRKLLAMVEGREMRGVGMLDGKGDEGVRRMRSRLEEAGEKGGIGKEKGKREEVLVKASGRACEKAVKVGEWFETREVERRCCVEVRRGMVSVVDDLVEVRSEMRGEEGGGADNEEEGESELVGGDTTMELLGKSTEEKTMLDQGDEAVEEMKESDEKKKRRRRKRKRPVYNKDDVPEQRLRWVKTVEVGVSLKG